MRYNLGSVMHFKEIEMNLKSMFKMYLDNKSSHL